MQSTQTHSRIYDPKIVCALFLYISIILREFSLLQGKIIEERDFNLCGIQHVLHYAIVLYLTLSYVLWFCLIRLVRSRGRTFLAAGLLVPKRDDTGSFRDALEDAAFESDLDLKLKKKKELKYAIINFYIIYVHSVYCTTLYI